MGLILPLLKTASNLFGGIWGYVGVAVLAGSIAGYGVGWTVHRVDLATYQALQLKDAKAVTQVAIETTKAVQHVADVQHAEDAIALEQALSEAAAQPKIVQKLVTITKEIPVYVSPVVDARVCIPYGLVRLLDATVLGGTSGPDDPSTLTLPTGQSDDSCSPVKASDLAASVTANYTTAEQNAEQLNALEDAITELIDKNNNP